MSPILEGIKVLDLTRLIAGPLSTQVLASELGLDDAALQIAARPRAHLMSVNE